MDDRQYTHYFVAFLDVLGFKDRVNNPDVSCGDILHIYDYLSKASKRFYEQRYEEIKDILKMKIMSDSICIYIREDFSNALFELVKFCAAFQRNLLTLDPCIFVRGGITHGDMYARDDIMFGPALTEAYMLEEMNAKVPRIIMCKSTLDYGKGGMDEKTQKRINKLVFQDDDAFFTLDYFRLFYMRPPHKEMIERVDATVSHWLDTTTNESIRQKYLYVDKHLCKFLKELKEKPDA